jgi:hypothetical protein
MVSRKMRKRTTILLRANSLEGKNGVRGRVKKDKNWLLGKAKPTKPQGKGRPHF